MTPVDKALWYIERHFTEDIGLAGIAAAAGVSRSHLARSFLSATGLSLMQYVRARRLTEAAKSLARGGPGVLPAAIDVGYGSHEAFTRAFRGQFGVPPRAVRGVQDLGHLRLVEPIRIERGTPPAPHPPRFERTPTLRIIGLRQNYDQRDSRGITAQWQRFLPHLAAIPRRAGRATFGICRRVGAQVIEYSCGVAVDDGTEIHPDLGELRMPAQDCAVFAYAGHAADIHRLWAAVRAAWSPAVDCDLNHGIGVERYDAAFDHDVGQGSVELWLPLVPDAPQLGTGT